MQRVFTAVDDVIRGGVALPLINAPRALKRAAIVAMDGMLCIAATAIAIYLRLGYLPALDRPMFFAAALSIALALGVFSVGGAYGVLFRYLSGASARRLTRNVFIYAVPYSGVFTYYGINGVPRTLGLLQPLILLLLILAGRGVMAALISFYGAERIAGLRPNVLIYGSGSAGRQLLGALRQSQEMIVVGFIDDDITLSGQMLDGIRVYRPPQIGMIVAEKDVSDVLLAIPSATRRRKNEIIANLRHLPLNVRTLPGMLDLAHGRVKVSDLREVEIDDLLGRNRVSPDPSLIRRNIVDRRVLVTGAGGSIGSELCRQIIEGVPETLILFDHSEFALYSIHQELEEIVRQTAKTVKIVPLLGSVSDPQMLNYIFSRYQPEVVFHAAAYKHVPMVEQNVTEAVRNNVLGTFYMARAALMHGTAHFVLISTDKAVRPTSVMGATKRLAEQVLQGLASTQERTCFCMVRFGNVLGSSGSVVPLFRAQTHAGGPITITHREMTRYFMLIPEAAQLVIQAGAMAEGGEVFLLDMGEPVKIIDLAYSMVALSGLTVRDEDNPDGDIEIREVGLRPGEKLFEELLIEDTSRPSDHQLIMKASEAHIPWDELHPVLAQVEKLIATHDEKAIIEQLHFLVPEFVGRRER